ncbi:hypothetical protein F4778DRAFT_404285 [Xylariomycetidae sp. FL2044]|nr:hypothetical protein F4778DRAFT_404285 [Xylariomycetidae sp. FL2044]
MFASLLFFIRSSEAGGTGPGGTVLFYIEGDEGWGIFYSRSHEGVVAWLASQSVDVDTPSWNERFWDFGALQ